MKSTCETDASQRGLKPLRTEAVKSTELEAASLGGWKPLNMEAEELLPGSA
jgi:hypothetical protein